MYFLVEEYSQTEIFFKTNYEFIYSTKHLKKNFLCQVWVRVLIYSYDKST